MSTSAVTLIEESAQRSRRWLDEPAMVAQAGPLAGETEAAYAVEAGARVLRRHVGADELNRVRSVLPHQIVSVLEGATVGGDDVQS